MESCVNYSQLEEGKQMRLYYEWLRSDDPEAVHKRKCIELYEAKIVEDSRKELEAIQSYYSCYVKEHNLYDVIESLDLHNSRITQQCKQFIRDQIENHRQSDLLKQEVRQLLLKG